MSGHCKVMLAELTEALKSAEARASIIEAAAHGPDILRACTQWLSHENAELARKEFATLPASFLCSLQSSLADADEHGLPFAIESVAPSLGGSLELARNGRVTWSVEADAVGIRMAVSHVHGHHAEWMNAPDRVLASA